MPKLLFWLKVSRPGLWFPTIWLYLLPLGQTKDLSAIDFWLGLLFVAFPLNFLIYGWNDIVDYETDQLNPRKDSFLFGAKGSQEQLKSLPIVIFVTQVLAWPYFIWLVGSKMLFLMAILFLVLMAYNLPKRGLRNTPPLDLAAQFGYLLVVPFSLLVNDAAPLPYPTYFYLLLFAFQSQLIGEVMDIEPDRKAGRKTTATLLGMKWTKLLIILFVALEVGLLVGVFGDYIFGGMLVLGLVWLLLDLFVIFKTQTYTLGQMRLFGVGSNVLALGSMGYVWWSGCLLAY